MNSCTYTKTMKFAFPFMTAHMGRENVNCEIVMVEDVGRDINVL